MSDATYYTWRKKFGGMGRLQLSELKALEKDHRSGRKPFTRQKRWARVLLTQPAPKSREEWTVAGIIWARIGQGWITPRPSLPSVARS